MRFPLEYRERLQIQTDFLRKPVVVQFLQKLILILDAFEPIEQKCVQPGCDVRIGQLFSGRISLGKKLAKIALLGEVVVLMIVLRVGKGAHRDDPGFDPVAVK